MSENLEAIVKACPTIPHLAIYGAERFGDDHAIEDEGLIITFTELEQARRQAAKAFLAQGIEKGDRVAIWAPNINEWITATLGLQTVGAILVPLNTRWKGKEAAYSLKKSGARMLLTVPSFAGEKYPEMIAGQDLPDLERVVLLRGFKDDITTWPAFLAEGEGVSDADLDDRFSQLGPDDYSDMLLTSGTTGNPKGVLTRHGQNVRVFATWSDHIGLKHRHRYLVVNPFFHSFGYKAGWMASIMNGATILPHQVFDAKAVLARISVDRVNVIPGPPTLYQSILADPDHKSADLSSLQLAITGAAAIPVELIHRMRDELKFDSVITAYGLTETCGVVTMCDHDDDAETIAKTSGKAIEGVEVRCVDDDNVEVPRGEPGEIIVRGYNVMAGYYDDPEETAKTIDADGWLHTGDIAVMDERGYVRITDRKKDMIIVGGFNCYPAEVENLILSDPRIAQAAVVGVPHERMGEVPKAFVVLAPGVDLTSDDIVSWCKENMANYKVPRDIEILSELPMTASGKVQKFLLR